MVGIIGGAVASGERGARRAAGAAGVSRGTAVAGECSYWSGERGRGLDRGGVDRRGGGLDATRAACDGYGVNFWLHARDCCLRCRIRRRRRHVRSVITTNMIIVAPKRLPMTMDRLTLVDRALTVTAGAALLLAVTMEAEVGGALATFTGPFVK